MEYTALKDKMIKSHIETLIDHIERKDLDYRLDELNNKLIEHTNNTIISEKKNEEESKKNIFQQNNEYMYKKPWNKLSEVHKIIKIKEYVKNQLGIIDKKYETELIKQLTKYIKNKILSKKKSVNYDMYKAKIISIPSLKYDGNKYIIDI